MSSLWPDGKDAEEVRAVYLILILRQSTCISTSAARFESSNIDQECQTRAWNEKGHKGDCRLLKDPDLQGLLCLPQDGFRQYHEFCGR